MALNLPLRDYLGVRPVRREDGTWPRVRQEGYKREISKYGDLIRADVSAHQAPALLEKICSLFTVPVEVLLEHSPSNEEPRQIWHSAPLSVRFALDALDSFLFPLFHDGTLAFGFGAPSQMEVYVTEHKIFRIYSIHQDKIERILMECGLSRFETFTFPDEGEEFCLCELKVIQDSYRQLKVNPAALKALCPIDWNANNLLEKVIRIFQMQPLVQEDSSEDALDELDELEKELNKLLKDSQENDD